MDGNKLRNWLQKSQFRNFQTAFEVLCYSFFARNEKRPATLFDIYSGRKYLSSSEKLLSIPCALRNYLQEQFFTRMYFANKFTDSVLK